MEMQISDFDITRFDSAAFEQGAPKQLAEALWNSLLALWGNQDLPCDDDLLSLLADGILSANLVSPNRPPTWVKLLCDGGISELRVRHTPNGIQYLKLDNYLVLALPEINSIATAEILVSELTTLQEQVSHITHWIFDMSSVRSYPSNLIAYLIGFNHGLKLISRQMLLLWVRKELMPENLLPAVQKHFQLIKKGMFYLSKPSSQP